MAQIDKIIQKCLVVKGQRPGKLVDFEEEEILWLCKTAKEVFLEQPNLLEVWENNLECVSPLVHPLTFLCLFRWKRPSRLLAMCTANTMTFSGCLSTVVFRPIPITYFWGW